MVSTIELTKRHKNLVMIHNFKLVFQPQEVEAVLPEVVKDAPIGQGYKTVKYARMVPLLIEAIKEQQVIINKQSQDIDELKQLVKQLMENK